jgi:hypothetical protein
MLKIENSLEIVRKSYFFIKDFSYGELLSKDYFLVLFKFPQQLFYLTKNSTNWELLI